VNKQLLFALVTVIALQRVAAAQDFGYDLRFQEPAIAPGGSAPIVFIIANAQPGFFTLRFSFVTPAGITIAPPSQTAFRGEAGFPPLTFTISVAPSVAPGSYPITGQIAVNGDARLDSYTFQVHVIEPPPAIISVTPSRVIAPSLPATLHITGTNFAQGGSVISQSPDIIVERTIVFSPTRADVVIRVREGAAAGAHRLDFRNPDGATSTRGGTLAVVGAGSIGAPLGVTTAAIVFPVDGTIVGDNDAIYPRAMLATSGSGAISGTWSVDGIPFDRFTVNAAARAVEVRTHIPLPPSPWGTHRITLTIDKPRVEAAPSVTYTATAESVTRLTFYDTAGRAIRWSLVPGATGYELEVRDLDANGAETGGARLRTTQTEWMPGAEVSGAKRYRVRAIFPGDVPGEATKWETATFVPVPMASAAPGAAPSTYVVEPNLTGTWQSNAPVPASNTSATFALSSQGESGNVTDASGTKLNGNLKYLGTPDPQHLGPQSRDWIGEARVMSGHTFASARLGYTIADFTDGARYLVSGAARTGVLARAGNDFGTISYYQPIEPSMHGVLSTVPNEPHIRSLGVATPEGRTYVFRLIGLEQRDGSTTSRTYGLFGRYKFGAQELSGELARGTATGDMRGNAARLSFAGTAAATTYALSVSNVGRDFVTPANRFFTAGFNNRIDTDLTLARTFGKSAFTLVAGHYRQHANAATPRGTSNLLTLGMIRPLTGIVTLETSAGFKRDYEERTTNRIAPTATMTLTESFSRIAFSEIASWNRTDDRVNSANDSTTRSLTISATGSLTPAISLISAAGYTGAKQWNVSVTPTFAVPHLLLSIRPSVAIDQSSKTYGAMLEWLPTWLQSLVSTQLSGTLTHASGKQTRGALASLVVHSKKTHGIPMFAAPPVLPGTEIPPAPAPQNGQPPPNSNS
jgi:hypothetical protein